MITYVCLSLALVLVGTLVVRRRQFRQLSFVVWKKALVLLSGLLAIACINTLSIGIIGSSENVSNRDIIFLLDLTYSMNAVDGRQGGDDTRLNNAKEDIAKIADKNIGAALGIYTFSNKADMLLPLTTNRADLQEALATTYTTTTYDTLPIISYKDTMNALEGYLQKQHELDPTRERVVIMMSDFEIYRGRENREEIVAAASSLKQYAGGFGYIVYGKDEGARLLLTTYDYKNGVYAPSYKIDGGTRDSQKYVMDREQNYEPVVSKPDQGLAEEVARTTGGKVARYTDSDDYAAILKDIAKAASNKAIANPASQALRQNWIYAPLSLTLFCWLVLSEFVKPKWLERVFVARGGKK